jgi:hypothetical protein
MKNETSAPLHLCWTTEQWYDYFLANETAPRKIPWDRGAELSDNELSAIARSLQDFQLGESSEGRHLIRCASAYALHENDPLYRDVVKLFIGEEQRHSRELGRFLQLAGIPLVRHSWLDTIFRWLRHRAGLELSITVLLTAEIISKVYYRAIRNATGSRVLQSICDCILADELEHVRFQCERLAILRRGRTALRLFMWQAWQRTLLGVTCIAVWWKHGRAMRSGGVGFGRLLSTTWTEFVADSMAMSPHTYEFEKPPLPGAIPVSLAPRAHC